MSFEALMGAIQRLSASAEALGALGAELRLRQSGDEADPKVRELLQEIVRGIDPNLLDGVSPHQEALALSIIRSGFHHVIDLLDNPERKPGWLHQDTDILQAIGRMSTRIVHQIDAFAAHRPALHQILTGSGSFLGKRCSDYTSFRIEGRVILAHHAHGSRRPY